MNGSCCWAKTPDGWSHPEPCDCVCHGGDVRAWLDSGEGEAWARGRFSPVDDQLGVFADLKPLGITGKPMQVTWPVLLGVA